MGDAFLFESCFFQVSGQKKPHPPCTLWMGHLIRSDLQGPHLHKFSPLCDWSQLGAGGWWNLRPLTLLTGLLKLRPSSNILFNNSLKWHTELNIICMIIELLQKTCRAWSLVRNIEPLHSLSAGVKGTSMQSASRKLHPAIMPGGVAEVSALLITSLTMWLRSVSSSFLVPGDLTLSQTLGLSGDPPPSWSYLEVHKRL